MTVHAEPSQPRRNEAILAAYSHARSSPLLEWLYDRPYTVLFPLLVAVFLSFQSLIAAAIFAVAVVFLAIVFGLALSLLEESGNCGQIIREVVEREEDQR